MIPTIIQASSLDNNNEEREGWINNDNNDDNNDDDDDYDDYQMQDDLSILVDLIDGVRPSYHDYRAENDYDSDVCSPPPSKRQKKTSLPPELAMTNDEAKLFLEVNDDDDILINE